MNVLYYVNNKTQKTVEKSGVGRALYHQLKAAELNRINYAQSLKDADVVHINTVFPDAVCMAIKSKINGVPVAYHAHSTKEDFRNSYIGANLVSGTFKQWIKFCYSLGDVIITPTEYSKKLLKGYGIKKPIYAVSNGIDLADYQPTKEKGKRFRERYGIGENEKVVMSIGLLMKRKGVPDFVELARRMPEYKFIWFGTANLKLAGSEVRKAVTENLPKNMIFAGYADKPKIQEALSGSDLFLFPSYEETEGIVVLEALAMKIPVILRNIPVYKGWLENKKSCYMTNDIDEFAKITGVLENRLPDLMENGYAVVKKKSLKIMGMQLLKVYQRAVMLRKKKTVQKQKIKLTN